MQSNLTLPRPYRRSDKREGSGNDGSCRRNSADAAVISTNDDAAVSKASCVSAGYFDDRFLRKFVGDGLTFSSLPRRPPLINRGYFCRHAAVSGLVEAFLSRVEERRKRAPSPSDKGTRPSERGATRSSATRSQIVSLGAGSDTLFFRLHEAGRSPDLYIELDLPEVVSKKAEIIASDPELSSRVGLDSTSRSSSEGRIVTSSYALLPCDLRSPRPVSTAIAAASSPSPSGPLSRLSFDGSSPTLFLSECVLVYLPPEAGDEVLRDACEMTTSATPGGGASVRGEAAVVVYDPCRPSTPFGRQMRRNLRARGCDLAGYGAFEDPSGAEERLRRCGWECGPTGSGGGLPSASAETLRDVWERRLPDESRSRASAIEPLDELEEWNLIMEHYFLAVGVKRQEGEEESSGARGDGGGERGVFDGFGLSSLRER